MKIILINETCGTGSIGRMTKELAEALEKRNHQVYVYCMSGIQNYHNARRIGSSAISANISKNLHAFMSRVTGLQG